MGKRGSVMRLMLLVAVLGMCGGCVSKRAYRELEGDYGVMVRLYEVAREDLRVYDKIFGDAKRVYDEVEGAARVGVDK